MKGIPKELEDIIIECAKVMTVNDICEEFSTPVFELKPDRVRELFWKKNIKALSPKEVALNYIKAIHLKKNIFEIAASLNMTTENVRAIAKENNIPLITQREEETKVRKRGRQPVSANQAIKSHPTTKATVQTLNDWKERILKGESIGDLDQIDRKLRELEGNPVVKKFKGKDQFTQTGSPFGFADKLKGIEICH